MKWNKKVTRYAPFAVIILAVAFIGLGAFSYKQANELKGVRLAHQASLDSIKTWTAEVNRLRTVSQGAPIQPLPEPAATEERESEEDVLARLGMSATTSEAIFSFVPFHLLHVVEFVDLGSGVYVLTESNPSSDMNPIYAWYVDTEKQSLRFLDGMASTMCSGVNIRAADYPKGFLVTKWSSPCEAVGSSTTDYYDRSGNKLASVSSGNFNRDGMHVDARIGEHEIKAALLQGGQCGQSNSYSLREGFVWPPTTTIIGLEVNNRSFELPKPIVVECELGYGDSVQDRGFPGLKFDGRSFRSHVPGYDIVITPLGSVRYTPIVTYSIAYEHRLMREDQDGETQVRANMLEDEIFRPLLVTEDDRYFYRFWFRGYQNNVVKLEIKKFNEETHRDEPFGWVEYDSLSDVFRNLVIN